MSQWGAMRQVFPLLNHWHITEEDVLTSWQFELKQAEASLEDIRVRASEQLQALHILQSQHPDAEIQLLLASVRLGIRDTAAEHSTAQSHVAQVRRGYHLAKAAIQSRTIHAVVERTKMLVEPMAGVPQETQNQLDQWSQDQAVQASALWQAPTNLSDAENKSFISDWERQHAPASQHMAPPASPPITSANMPGSLAVHASQTETYTETDQLLPPPSNRRPRRVLLPVT